MKYKDFEYEIINHEVRLIKYDGLNSRVYIPDEINGHIVTIIGEGCFENNETMEKIRFPQKLQVIETDAITKCSQLLELHFPNSSLTIESNAVSLCFSLRTVTIPEKVKSIYVPAFMACQKLDTILVDPRNEKYMSIDDILFLKDPFYLIKYPEDKMGKRYITPDIVGIAMGGFAFNKHLKRVLLPTSLNIINSCGFYDSNIDKLSIPHSVNALGEGTFCDCEHLEKIVLSNNIKRIEEGTFKNCTKLDHIVIPKSVRYLDCNAFEGCKEDLVVQVHKQCHLQNKDQFHFNLEIEE